MRFSVTYNRDVISVFSRGGGGKILTDFLGGAKYEKQNCVRKNTKIFIFKNQPCPSPNDVPDLQDVESHHKSNQTT